MLNPKTDFNMMLISGVSFASSMTYLCASNGRVPFATNETNYFRQILASIIAVVSCVAMLVFAYFRHKIKEVEVAIDNLREIKREIDVKIRLRDLQSREEAKRSCLERELQNHKINFDRERKRFSALVSKNEGVCEMFNRLLHDYMELKQGAMDLRQAVEKREKRAYFFGATYYRDLRFMTADWAKHLHELKRALFLRTGEPLQQVFQQQGMPEALRNHFILPFPEVGKGVMNVLFANPMREEIAAFFAQEIESIATRWIQWDERRRQLAVGVCSKGVERPL